LGKDTELRGDKYGGVVEEEEFEES